MKIEYRHLNWMQLIWDADLTYKAKLVASYLTSHMNANHHIAWPSIRRIAAKTGLSEKTVKRSIPELEQASWIMVERGGINKGTSRYTPIFPPDIESLLGSESPQLGSESPQSLGSHSPQLGSHSPQSLGSESPPNQSIQSDNNNQGDFVLPAPVDKSAWSDFDAHRNSSAKLKKTWSKRAKEIAAHKLCKLTPEQQRECVEYSILGGYPGLYPDRLQTKTIGAQDETRRRPNSAERAFSAYKNYAKGDTADLDSGAVCQVAGEIRPQVVEFPSDRRDGKPGDG